MSGPLIDRGIYHKSQPTAQDCFRARTDVHAKMAGVQYAKFTCKCCGLKKSIEGRRRVNPKYPKDGYKCASCVAQS